MNNISICLSPALYPFYAEKDTTVIVVDIFRATTSICAAFYNGARSVKTVATIEEAKQMKLAGYLVAAERNVKRCDFADFGNSPFDFTPEKVKNQDLIFTTTNGTQAVEMALEADEILIGAFSNIQSLCSYCLLVNKNILIICSGWNNRVCIEDTLFAANLTEKLLKTKKFEYKSDAVRMALEIWNLAKKDLKTYICTTEHYERLKNNELENSVDYCLAENTTPLIPKYDKITKTFLITDKIYENK